MIITKEVKIKYRNNDKEYYKNLGYDISQKEIIVKVKDLLKNSHVKIEVKCDYCGKEKIVKNQDYNISLLKGDTYSCNNTICLIKKREENSLVKYGVNSTNKLKETQDKKKKTCLKKYGVENVSKISQDKVRMTKLKNHGNDKYNNRNKFKKTTLKKYGVENYRLTKEYAEKVKVTCLNKYGVDHYSQVPEIHKKQQFGNCAAKKYKNLYYRGSYEFDFIKYCEKNNIDIENGPTIVYYSGNTKKLYYSDFKLKNYNLLCEIKSEFYYNLDINMNMLKKEYSIKNGYDFIFIIDKDYTEFNKKWEKLISPIL